jgi:hypothetical protein
MYSLRVSLISSRNFRALLTISLQILPFIVAALCTSTSAAAIKRDSCVYTCGSVCYWQSDITAAVNKGYTELKAGKTLGSGRLIFLTYISVDYALMSLPFFKNTD